MSRKARILGIAPYEGLATLMTQYGAGRQDVELTAFLGNMERGVALAKEHYSDYDMIISRANTASMISQAVPIPVIDIKMDYYDVLLCIKMAEQTRTRFAFIGFHSLTTIAQTLCDLLKTPIDIFSISTPSEAGVLLDKLKGLGYETVICDTVAYDHAKFIGITPILLTSSLQSLKAAVDSAVDTYQRHLELYQSTLLMRQVLKNSNSDYIVLDMDGQCLFSTFETNKTVSISNKLKEELEHCREDASRSFFTCIENQMYSVYSSLSDDRLHTYVIFQLNASKIPLAYSKYGIAIMDRREAEDSFTNSFYSNTELGRGIIADTNAAVGPKTGLMIIGEIGTGKDRVAHLYYSKSDLQNNPLYVINCSFINDKSWNFITNHYKSPFTDNGNTIYISNIDRLSCERQKKLLAVILDTNVHVRNLLLFSCTQSAGEGISHVAVEYVNTLGLTLTSIKPLRERKDDIASSAGLYINTLDRTLGKQVVGLEEGAIKLLEDYEYPYNHSQFKRILKEAVLKTSAPYIKGEIIRQLLEQEAVLAPHSHCGSTHVTPRTFPIHTDSGTSDDWVKLNLNQHLDSINKDIVLHTLKGCNNNQTAAAKKLGISRTTLWRYLNR